MAVERVCLIGVDDTTVAVIGVVVVRESVVVVVPVGVVRQSVAVDIGVEVVGAVVTEHRAVQQVEIIVVVEIAVLVDVEPVEDSVVVVVDVLPVVDAVAVPIVVAGVRFSHQDAVLVRVDRVGVGEAGAVPGLNLIVGRHHEWVFLIGNAVVIEIEWDVVGVNRRAAEGVVGQCRTSHVLIKPVPYQIVVLVYRSVPVIIEISIVVQLAIYAGYLYPGVWHRIVPYSIAIGVDLIACIWNAVVVIVDIVHVHQAVVVVVGVGRVGSAIVVVIRIDEVGNSIAIQIAIDNRVESLIPRMPKELALHVIDTSYETRIGVGSSSRGGYGDSPGHRRVKHAGVVVGPCSGEGETP